MDGHRGQRAGGLLEEQAPWAFAVWGLFWVGFGFCYCDVVDMLVYFFGGVRRPFGGLLWMVCCQVVSFLAFGTWDRLVMAWGSVVKFILWGGGCCDVVVFFLGKGGMLLMIVLCFFGEPGVWFERRF